MINKYMSFIAALIFFSEVLYGIDKKNSAGKSSSPEWNFTSSTTPENTLGWNALAGFASPFKVSDGTLTATMQQPHAYTNVMDVNFNADDFPFLAIRVKASKPCSGSIGIYFKTEKNSNLSEAMKTYKSVSFTEEWQSAVIDLK